MPRRNDVCDMESLSLSPHLRSSLLVILERTKREVSEHDIHSGEIHICNKAGKRVSLNGSVMNA